MRTALFLTAGSLAALALSACAPSTLPQRDGSPASASPTTGGPLSGTPEPPLVAEGDTTGDPDVTRYVCSTGAVLVVRYPAIDTAVVSYDGEDRPMTLGAAIQGARYVGSDYEWWTDNAIGDDSVGTLYTHASDDSTGREIMTCRERD